VGLKDDLDGTENLTPPSRFDAWTVQPVASCYTKHDVLATTVHSIHTYFYETVRKK